MKMLLCAVAMLGRDELSDAIAKLKAGYAFSIEAENKTIRGRDPVFAIDGCWTKDAPLRATSGGIEMLRARALAWKEKDGAWTSFDPRAGIKAGEQERHALLLRVSKLRAPHEELEALAKAVKNLKPGKDGLLEADLDAAACLDILSDGKPGPASAAQTGHTGKAKIRIEKGAVARVEFAITWTETHLSHVGESKTAVTWRKTVAIKDVGAVKIEVPEAARKLVE